MQISAWTLAPPLCANVGTTAIEPGINVPMGDTNLDGQVTSDDYNTIDASAGSVRASGSSSGTLTVTAPSTGALEISSGDSSASDQTNTTGA